MQPKPNIKTFAAKCADFIGQYRAGRFQKDVITECTEFGDGKRTMQSPIEHILYIALKTVIEVESIPWYSMDREKGNIGILVLPQPNIAGHYVDFYIGYFAKDSKDSATVIVECDGHDFHEKDKKQAAADKRRDREIQDAGYVVRRYAGSEVFSDPLKVACEIVNIVMQKERRSIDHMKYFALRPERG